MSLERFSREEVEAMISALALLADEAHRQWRELNAGTWVSVAQAADLLRCSPTTVRRRAARGVLASSREGGSLKIQRGSIDALLDTGREPPSVAFRRQMEPALRLCKPRGQDSRVADRVAKH